MRLLSYQVWQVETMGVLRSAHREVDVDVGLVAVGVDDGWRRFGGLARGWRRVRCGRFGPGRE